MNPADTSVALHQWQAQHISQFLKVQQTQTALAQDVGQQQPQQEQQYLQQQQQGMQQTQQSSPSNGFIAQQLQEQELAKQQL